MIYVFHKRPIDAEQTAQSLADGGFEALSQWDGSERKATVLSYDVGYAHAAEEVYQKLQEHVDARASGSGSHSRLPPLVLSRLDTAKNFEGKVAVTSEGSHTSNEGTERASTGCGCGSTQDSQVQGRGCGTNGNATYGCVTNGCSSNGCSAAPLLPTAEPQDIDTLAGSDGSGRQYSLPTGTTLEDCLILYLGGESLALTNLLLRAGPTCPVISYDPHDAARGMRREDGRTNKLLMRRYAAVQKARDASVVGLLVGTLGVQSYLPLLSHLRQLLTGRRPGAKKSSGVNPRGAGRKVYTISVGKLSPAKLANFQEIDIFVLLACPENSLVDAVDPTGLRSKEFYKPIVTPFEMMLALDEDRSWTGTYVLEMNRLEKEAEEQAQRADCLDGESQDEGEERPHFSLVTGGYVSRRRYENHEFGEDPQRISSDPSQSTTHESSIILKDSNSGQLTRILDSASALHLSGRSWRGLEQRLGMDQPSVLEEGRAGIARQYAEADGTREG